MILDGAAPPALDDVFGEDSNIESRTTVPSLSYEGKVWSISINGEKTKLTKLDEDGDEIPMPVMRVWIVGYNKDRGRAYYEGAYDPAASSAPLCWSDDGKKPDASVSEPQCDNCATCPMAAKGSKITEQGKSVTACSQHRMVAVVPAHKPDFPPLRLKLAITSDWDKQSPELAKQQWFAFSNYIDFIKANGVSHTARIVTKMRFDSSVAYPKVIFHTDRWTTPEEAPIVKAVADGDEVKELLAGTWTAAGVDGVPIPKMDIEGDMPEADDLDDAPVEKKAAPKKAAPKKAAAKPKVKDTSDVEDAEVVEEEAPKKASKKAEEPETVSEEVPDDLADLLSDWDDD